MTVISLSRRLRRIEAQRRLGDDAEMGFFVWGRTRSDIDASVASLDVPPIRMARILWPFAEDPPASRWSSVDGLSDRELEAIIAGCDLGEARRPARHAAEMSDTALGNALPVSMLGRGILWRPA